MEGDDWACGMWYGCWITRRVWWAGVEVSCYIGQWIIKWSWQWLQPSIIHLDSYPRLWVYTVVTLTSIIWIPLMVSLDLKTNDLLSILLTSTLSCVHDQVDRLWLQLVSTHDPWTLPPKRDKIKTFPLPISIWIHIGQGSEQIPGYVDSKADLRSPASRSIGLQHSFPVVRLALTVYCIQSILKYLSLTSRRIRNPRFDDLPEHSWTSSGLELHQKVTISPLLVVHQALNTSKERSQILSNLSVLIHISAVCTPLA